MYPPTTPGNTEHCMSVLSVLLKYSFITCVQEMQQQMNVLNQKPNMPDMSEMITNYFSGGKKPVKSKASSKRK